MFGPAAVLDDYGSATEASGLQNFLQWIPNPYVFERENSDRNAPIQRNRYQIVSLAETLSWSIPDANRGMSTNSPGTRCSMRFPQRRNGLAHLGEYVSFKNVNPQAGGMTEDRLRSTIIMR